MQIDFNSRMAREHWIWKTETPPMNVSSVLGIRRSSINVGRFSNQIMRFHNIQNPSNMPIRIIIHVKIEISNNQLGRRPGESAIPSGNGIKKLFKE